MGALSFAAVDRLVGVAGKRAISGESSIPTTSLCRLYPDSVEELCSQPVRNIHFYNDETLVAVTSALP
jgi:hypothetical protein